MPSYQQETSRGVRYQAYGRLCSKKNMNRGNETDPTTQTFLLSLVFQTATEAESFRSNFSFEGNTQCLEYCEYGKVNKKAWPKDVFAFFHNPVRCEVLELANILRVLQGIGRKLTIGHFVNVRMWWLTCSAIILDYLDMEVKSMEPWIAIALEQKENQDDCKVPLKFFQAMPNRQKEIRDLTSNITVAFGDVCNPESKLNGDFSDA